MASVATIVMMAGCSGGTSSRESDQAAAVLSDRLAEVGADLHVDDDALTDRLQVALEATAHEAGRATVTAEVDRLRLAELTGAVRGADDERAQGRAVQDVLQRWAQVQGFLDGAAAQSRELGDDERRDLGNQGRIALVVASAQALDESGAVASEGVDPRLYGEDRTGAHMIAANLLPAAGATSGDLRVAYRRGMETALEG